MLSVVLKSEWGTAKLNLPLLVLFSCCCRYVAFVELIDLDAWWRSWFSTNQRLRNYLTPHTHTQHTENRHTSRCSSTSSICNNACFVPLLGIIDDIAAISKCQDNSFINFVALSKIFLDTFQLLWIFCKPSYWVDTYFTQILEHGVTHHNWL